VGSIAELEKISASPDGGTLSYKWYRAEGASDGTFTPISGATTRTHNPYTGMPGVNRYRVIVTNTNLGVNGVQTAYAISDYAIVTINALTHAQYPNISGQPQGGTVTQNSNITLSVTADVADDGDLSFQWYSNTINSNTGGIAITGATSTTFSPPTSVVGTVYYYVVVTNTNPTVTGNQTATATSTAASVTVQASGGGGGSGGWRPPVTDDQTPNVTEHPQNGAATTPNENGEIPIEQQFPFIDVAVTDWFYPFVRTVWENQLFDGTSHNTFTPTGHMTRAMFVQVLANMENVDLTVYQANSTNPTFADTAPTAWYFGAVEWAAGQGLAQGLGNDNFEPGRAITREEMAVMLNNYVISRNIALPQGALRIFTDQDNISDWAIDAVRAIQAAGIIEGYPDGRFAPGSTATRAEVATIFARFLDVSLGR